MHERPQSIMRVEPETIPSLIAVYKDAVRQLDYVLRDFALEARIERPWMGDPVSAEVARRFTAHAVEGPDSALAQMRLFRDEMVKIVDNLERMKADYAATEAANEQSFRRL